MELVWSEGEPNFRLRDIPADGAPSRSDAELVAGVAAVTAARTGSWGLILARAADRDCRRRGRPRHLASCASLGCGSQPGWGVMAAVTEGRSVRRGLQMSGAS